MLYCYKHEKLRTTSPQPDVKQLCAIRVGVWNNAWNVNVQVIIYYSSLESPTLVPHPVVLLISPTYTQAFGIKYTYYCRMQYSLNLTAMPAAVRLFSDLCLQHSFAATRLRRWEKLLLKMQRLLSLLQNKWKVPYNRLQKSIPAAIGVWRVHQCVHSVSLTSTSSRGSQLG